MDLKFGVYLSPWDRNHAEYGRAATSTYYRNQLKEFIANTVPFLKCGLMAPMAEGYYGGAKEKRNINGATYYD